MFDQDKWVWVVIGLVMLVVAGLAMGVSCSSCLRLSSQWPGFVTGTTLLGGLIGGMTWLESAPLRQVAQHGVVALVVLSAVFSLL